MSEWSGAERRRTPRFCVELVAEVERLGRGRTRDVSLGGCFIVFSHGAQAPGGEVLVTLQLASERDPRPLALSGRGRCTRVETLARGTGMAFAVAQWSLSPVDLAP